MRLVLQRQTKTPSSIGGELTINGTWAAWTMENTQYAIPAGTYEITLWESQKFNRIMPLLNDVSGCPYPEIHWGSYPSNYEGCIGVGTMHSEDRLWNTKEKWDEIFPLIEAAIKSGEGCDIQIIDIPAALTS